MFKRKNKMMAAGDLVDETLAEIKRRAKESKLMTQAEAIAWYNSKRKVK